MDGVIAQSGGHIRVTSSPGAGATFSIFLPAASMEVVSPSRVLDRAESRGGRETVLVCEDEAGVRRLLEYLLVDAGYRVLTAGRPSEALELFAREPIDALVSDVIMPDMPGPELARIVQERDPRVRTLFVSGYTAETVRGRGNLPAGSAFLEKPIDRATLLGTLRELFDATDALGPMLFYEPHARDRELLPHDPFKAIVAPRPIGWVSTLGPDGEANLAPYSFFNAVCDQPPMIAFSSAGRKDSMTFGGYARRVRLEHADVGPARADEPVLEGAAARRERVRVRGPDAGALAPRRAAARGRGARRARVPRAVGDRAARSATASHAEHFLVLGQVVGVHVDERYIVDGRVDTAALTADRALRLPRGVRGRGSSLFAMWRP